jgi:predicted MPP superfamily phosphohydrolase
VPLVVFGVLAAGLLCVLYGIAVEHHWYRVRRYRLDILPATAPAPVLVLHVSDLHLLRRDHRLRGFLASLPPCDVVVATGDLVGEPGAVEVAVAALAPVRGRLASLFVLGSNDYFRPRPLNPFRYFRAPRPAKRRAALRGRGTELAAQLVADGWTHLKNVHGELDLGGLAVEVAGMDDPHIHRADLRVTRRRRPELLGLAVVHSPDPAPELAAAGWDLIVAGHTHGGQVRLPGVGALVTNSHMPRRFASGLVRIGRSVLHTSPGLGTSRYAPFRFLCRPEAAILELRPAVDYDHGSGRPGSKAASRTGASPN